MKAVHLYKIASSEKTVLSPRVVQVQHTDAHSSVTAETARSWALRLSTDKVGNNNSSAHTQSERDRQTDIYRRERH